LEFLRRTVFANLPRLEISSKQSQFLVYNPFREPVHALEEQARALAPKEYIYLRLQPADVGGVRKLFETILEQSMFKIKDGILANAVMRDRDNNLILRDRRNGDQQNQRKYNRCC
jgi:hypothetical protein